MVKELICAQCMRLFGFEQAATEGSKAITLWSCGGHILNETFLEKLGELAIDGPVANSEMTLGIGLHLLVQAITMELTGGKGGKKGETEGFHGW